MVAQTSQELLKEQIEAIGNRKPKFIEPAKRVGIEYNSDLQRIVNEVRKDINKFLVPFLREIAPQYQQDSLPTVKTKDGWSEQLLSLIQFLLKKWDSPEFNGLANRLAGNFVNAANQFHQKQFNKQYDIGIDVFANNPLLQDYINTASFENAQLIQSIPAQYLGSVQNIVLGNVRAGLRPSAIAPLLQDQYGITKRRAQFIARDQTAKVNGELSAKRQQAVGFDYFRWVDSSDSRVRNSHRAIANKVTAYGKGIYRWDNPPKNERGEVIIPGKDFGCRCVSIPVSAETVEKNQRKGDVKKGVYN